MNASDVRANETELPALDGANPLGFLTALGTLVTLRDAGEVNARLRWHRGRTWVPVVNGVSTDTPSALGEIISQGLRGRVVSAEAERKREELQGIFETTKKAVGDKKKEIGKRGIKGKDRREAFEREVRPLEQHQDQKRKEWLEALTAAVPKRELAIGKRIDCTRAEYRQHAAAFRARAGCSDRDTVDLLAAFGSDACLQERSDAIAPTPFQLITGSGHQYFLETVRQLIETVSAERVRNALFEPWSYSDEGLSMRWDPLEDRRYALMDRDPTASDNKSRTMWMANLLAYRALALFPSAPRNRFLSVTGWAGLDDNKTFTWPMWEFPASPDVIRSLLQLREITSDEPDGSLLRARGIAAAFRARRIKVGAGANYKLNFSPARAV